MDSTTPPPKKRGRPPKSDSTTGASKSKSVSAKQPAKQVARGGAWMTHVKKTFTAGKKKNSTYTYKQAMSDAKKTYKKPK